MNLTPSGSFMSELRKETCIMTNLGFNNVKLTDKEVYHILFLNRVKGMKPSQIEKMFSVSKATIKNILTGKSRKDCYFAYLEYEKKHPKKIKTLFD